MFYFGMSSNKVFAFLVVIILSLVALLAAAPFTPLLENLQPDANPEGRDLYPLLQKVVKRSPSATDITSESQLPVMVTESNPKSSLLEQQDVIIHKEKEKSEDSKITADTQNVNLDDTKGHVKKEPQTDEVKMVEIEPVSHNKELEVTDLSNSETTPTEIPVSSKSNVIKVASKTSLKKTVESGPGKSIVDEIKSVVEKTDVIKKLNVPEIRKEDEDFLNGEVKKVVDVAKIELDKDGGELIEGIKKTGNSFLTDIQKSEGVKKFLAKVNSYSDESDKNSEKIPRKEMAALQSKSKNVQTSAEQKLKKGEVKETSVEKKIKKEGAGKKGIAKEGGILGELMEMKDMGESALEDVKKAGEVALDELKKKGQSALDGVKKAGTDFLGGLKKKLKLKK